MMISGDRRSSSISRVPSRRRRSTTGTTTTTGAAPRGDLLVDAFGAFAEVIHEKSHRGVRSFFIELDQGVVEHLGHRALQVGFRAAIIRRRRARARVRVVRSLFFVVRHGRDSIRSVAF